MSLSVEGASATDVSYSGLPTTVISRRFYTAIRARTPRLLVTTTELESEVSLGLDWAAFLRLGLTQNGLRIDSTFDAWQFFSAPDHPFSSRMNPPLSGPSGQPAADHSASTPAKIGRNVGSPPACVSLSTIG
ncbi:hypothetical protein B0H11DRAFT_2268351 [Mycena galericulata]|nr:hypothetical protein B0H11DRAFT_2268351 [Mycena galericulata]